MNPISVRTYPLGNRRNMVEFVCTTGISERPVYKDADGSLWEQDLGDGEIWYSKVTDPRKIKEYLKKAKGAE